MAKKAYIGIGGKARKIKRIYFGVAGKARKVKRAYIGVGGKARLFFSGGELAYAGAITPLSQEKLRPSATNVGNYALFVGGLQYNDYKDYTYSYSIDAYSASLTKSNPGFPNDRDAIAAASNADYALFAGGAWEYDYYRGNVDAFNNTLTRTDAPRLHASKTEVTGTNVGGYILFAGGAIDSSGDKVGTNIVEVYSTSLTKSTATAMSLERYGMASSTVGNYALISGGNYVGIYNYTYETDLVEAYNSSLTKTTPMALTSTKEGLSATNVDDYALFAGGTNSGAAVTDTATDAYNSSLTRISIAPLSVARYALAATSIGDYALFGGGNHRYLAGDPNHAGDASVDVYDSSLTRIATSSLSVGRGQLAAASVGDYALFGGGNYFIYKQGTFSVNTVDAYLLN